MVVLGNFFKTVMLLSFSRVMTARNISNETNWLSLNEHEWVVPRVKGEQLSAKCVHSACTQRNKLLIFGGPSSENELGDILSPKTLLYTQQEGCSYRAYDFLPL